MATHSKFQIPNSKFLSRPCSRTPCYGSVVSEETPRPAATVVVLRDSAARTRGVHGPASCRHRLPGRPCVSGRAGRRGGRRAGDQRLVRWPRPRRPADCRIFLGPRQWRFTSPRVRELFEEAGVLVARRAAGGFVSLADGGSHQRFMDHRAAVHARSRTLRAIAEGESLRVALDALLLFAHWVTPPLPIEGRRFDTRFFMTRVPEGQVPAHDDRETTDGVWMTPREAIARAVQPRDRPAAADMGDAPRARTARGRGRRARRGRPPGGWRAANRRSSTRMEAGSS